MIWLVMEVIVILSILLLVAQSNQFTNQFIDIYGSHKNLSGECTDENCGGFLPASSSKGDVDVNNVKNNNSSIPLLNYPGNTINYSLSLSNNIKRVNPELSSSDNNVYVVWEEGSHGKSYVVLKKSNDSGANFAAPMNITSPAIATDYSVHPDIAASGNNVYVVWQNIGSLLQLKMSNDYGSNFSAPMNITSPANATDYSVHPNIAASGNNVYVVWKDSISGIFFKKSEDRGETFGSNIRLDEDLTNRRGSDGSDINKRQGVLSDLNISVSGNNVYVVWKDSISGIFFKKSEDRGETFGSNIKLSQGNNVAMVATPSISSFDNNVYVVWEEGSHGKSYVVLKKSNDYGSNFSAPMDISHFLTNRFDISFSPEIASFDNMVFINLKSVGLGTIFRSSMDNGSSFSPPLLLSNATNVSDLKITASDNILYVVWKNSTLQNNNIFFKKGYGGAFASNEIMLTKDTGQPLSGPALSSVNNNVYVVWEEGSHGKSYVVLKKSNDYGSNFSAPMNITSPANATDYSVHPDPNIAASGNNVYVVWKDSISGIFYKKSEDRGETFGSNIRLDEELTNRSDSNYISRRGTISDLHLSTLGNNVYVVWKDSISGIFLKKSEDRGETYNPITLLTNRTNVSHLKMVASTNNNVHLTWQDIVSGHYSIFYKRSNDGEKSFGEVIKLNARGDDSYEPDITAANSNNVFVVWKSANTGIWFRSSMDNGASFSPPVLLSNATNVSDLKVTTMGTNVYVVWKSSTIILKTSLNNGTAFSRGLNVANITNGHPTELNLYGATQIEVSSIANRLYIVWMQPEVSLRDESRSMYFDIFFLNLN